MSINPDTLAFLNLNLSLQLCKSAMHFELFLKRPSLCHSWNFASSQKVIEIRDIYFSFLRDVNPALPVGQYLKIIGAYFFCFVLVFQLFFAEWLVGCQSLWHNWKGKFPPTCATKSFKVFVSDMWYLPSFVLTIVWGKDTTSFFLQMDKHFWGAPCIQQSLFFLWDFISTT